MRIVVVDEWGFLIAPKCGGGLPRKIRQISAGNYEEAEGYN
jgi:hypothetical protein